MDSTTGAPLAPLVRITVVQRFEAPQQSENDEASVEVIEMCPEVRQGNDIVAAWPKLKVSTNCWPH
jgi:hypothetical protein